MPTDIEVEIYYLPQWEAAAIQILDIYRKGGWLPTEIEVEIYNPLKMAWNRSHVLSESNNVMNALNSLRPAIEGEMRGGSGVAVMAWWVFLISCCHG